MREPVKRALQMIERECVGEFVFIRSFVTSHAEPMPLPLCGGAVYVGRYARTRTRKDNKRSHTDLIDLHAIGHGMVDAWHSEEQ